MTEFDAKIQQTEVNIADHKHMINLRELVLKLQKNPDFVKLINEEFMVKECARFAQVSGDPALSATDRADAMLIAQSAGCLKRFLSVCVQRGNTAEAQLPQYEAFLDELRAEGGE